MLFSDTMCYQLRYLISSDGEYRTQLNSKGHDLDLKNSIIGYYNVHLVVT